jgi:hypothetical protein
VIISRYYRFLLHGSKTRIRYENLGSCLFGVVDGRVAGAEGDSVIGFQQYMQREAAGEARVRRIVEQRKGDHGATDK